MYRTFRYIWLAGVVLSLIVSATLIINDVSRQAQAEVQIQSPDPSHTVIPQIIPEGAVTKVRITGTLVAGHNGFEIAVYKAAGILFPDSCFLPPPPALGAGVIKWQLRADTDGTGATRADFIDPGGFTEVGYTVGLGESFSVVFGNGGTAELVDVVGTPTLTPDPSVDPWAWIDVDGGPGVVLPITSPNPGPGSDNSEDGNYIFASCGTEGAANLDYVGDAEFLSVEPSTNLTKSANVTFGYSPLPVKYTYNETNDGDASLKMVSITDNTCSPVTLVSGDDGDNILEPSESWIFECTNTLTMTTTNTAFATGTSCVDDPDVLGDDCLIEGKIHTGNPNCVVSNSTHICDQDELDTFTVTVASIITQSNPSGGIVPGAAVTDKATIDTIPPGLLPAPTGTVKFFLCNPVTVLANGGDCRTGGTMIGGPIPLAGTPPMATSAAASGATTTPNGKYCWRAEYSGDGNYPPRNHTNSNFGNNGECFQVAKGTIKIIKDTIPDDGKDFKFTHHPSAGPTTTPIPSNPLVLTNGKNEFFLDDDFSPPLSNTQTFLEVPAGSYTVTEMTVSAIPLQSIRCIDPDDGSVRAGNSAIIDLDAGETVTCTFVNAVELPPCEDGIVSVPQPEDAISMTTIKKNNIAKTIHAEKQIFDCELPQADIPVIADVTIIAEIYQDLNTKSIISKEVQVVTCLKDPATMKITLGCKLSKPSTDRIPVTNCLENTDITHPQEMNTVRKGSTAKTIETQKMVYLCDLDGFDREGIDNQPVPCTVSGPGTNSTCFDPEKKVDLVIFTDIYQNLNTRISDAPQILSMKCVIKIDTVTVESCRFTSHPV